MREIVILILGELLVSLITVGVYVMLDKFSYAVPSGCLLGSAVAIFNFIFLSVAVNRAIDKVMEARGDKDMSDGGRSRVCVPLGRSF